MALDLLRRIRNFRAPVDPATANELSQQLAKFEDNASQMGTDLLVRTMAALQPLPETVVASGKIVAAGQFARCDTSRGNLTVLLTQARPDRRGLLLVIKTSAANVLTIMPQGSALIDGSASLAYAAIGARLLFCDGEGYWSI